MRWFRMKLGRMDAVAFTRKNFTNASGNFRVTAVRAGGKKKISRDFCDSEGTGAVPVPLISATPQRASLQHSAPVRRRHLGRSVKQRGCRFDVLLDQVP